MNKTLNNNIKKLSELPKEKQDKFFSNLEEALTKHVQVLKKEIEDNGGKIPQHRIDEERRLGLI